ncbi:MAG: aminotransferase class I/II-fold pyridoxal phosphate-dependent enzyme [Clostridia bacterium]|nr:aminotransferase class I/II-fold pyridoxal phosphate-dependent enzyme [Clostridia bacterium]
MKRYDELTKFEREKLYNNLKLTYDKFCEMNLKLDLSRGKPNMGQLDISESLLSMPLTKEDYICNGVDYRNYGILDGVPKAKELFSDILNIPKDYIFVGGNSSLQLMYDLLSKAMLFGLKNSERPWCKEEGLKWICITPGYDRHFKITETLGFELVSVKMTKDGPDMDEVERLALDPKVKGIWCVPKYSNPTGNTYSNEVVTRLAKMKCSAPDFCIMWDNAYAIHDFSDDGDKLLDIFSEAKKYGNEDRVYCFSSTSKVTFPGAGVSIMATSPSNLKYIMPYISVSTIGYDKLNQLKHIKFLKDAENTHNQMMKLASIIKPKFEITLSALSDLNGLGIAEWSKPNGGYFISLDILVGSAKRVYELMKNAGVTLTSVGATYPYGKDPEDKNLRLAPTYPENEDLSLACIILVLSVKLSALEKLLKD